LCKISHSYGSAFGVENNIELIEDNFKYLTGATMTEKALDLWLNEVAPSRDSQ
jgi:hypothetical protein